jgi:hypothetical protein
MHLQIGASGAMHAAARLARLSGPSCCPVQAVPANLTRYGLSQIINHLLALGACLTAAPPLLPRHLPPVLLLMSLLPPLCRPRAAL